jgi:hypothetical protein
MLKKFRVKISGDSWEVFLLKRKTFVERFGKDTAAITTYLHKTKLRQIYFQPKDKTKGTVMHEVIHAYLSYRDLSKMSYGAIEELICDFLPRRLDAIKRTTDRIIKRLVE